MVCLPTCSVGEVSSTAVSSCGSVPQDSPVLTISSLHMGHTILELAAAAAWAEACSSRATRDVRPSFSVDTGMLDACELRDTELSEGDSKPEFGVCDLFTGGGARLLPVPSTLPPPKALLAAMFVTDTKLMPLPSRVSSASYPTYGVLKML